MRRLKRVHWFGISVAIVFLILSVFIKVHATSIQAIDLHLHHWVIKHRTHGEISIAKIITWGGVAALTLPTLVLVGAFTLGVHRRVSSRLGNGLLLAAFAALGGLVELVINFFLHRTRPPIADWLSAASRNSFPSGHATTAALFALFSAWALRKRIRQGWPQITLWVGAATYVLGVGWSRIWLGVHWPSDVLGGWLYATAWFIFTISVFVQN
jgi:membrane-associated phospholipid phosphatase